MHMAEVCGYRRHGTSLPQSSLPFFFPKRNPHKTNIALQGDYAEYVRLAHACAA